jgi:AAA+ ATPase superfamily predicted ATPase
LLRRELKRRGFGLLVIYGRRRVGKTALVLKATEDVRRLTTWPWREATCPA